MTWQYDVALEESAFLAILVWLIAASFMLDFADVNYGIGFRFLGHTISYALFPELLLVPLTALFFVWQDLAGPLTAGLFTTCMYLLLGLETTTPLGIIAWYHIFG